MEIQPPPVIPCREEATARLRVSTCFGADRTQVGGSYDARPVAPRTRTRANAWVARDGRRKFVD